MSQPASYCPAGPDSKDQGIWKMLVASFDQWSEDEASRSAASVAFYTMLSLAPLLVIAVAIAGWVLGPKAAEGQLYAQIHDLVGSEGAKAIQDMMKAAYKPATGIISSLLGLGTLLFAASSLVGELRTSLNHIWKVKASSDSGISFLVKERSKLFALVIGSGFLLLVSLLVSTVLASVGKFVQSWLPIPEWSTHVISFGISYVVISLLFAILFKVLPETHIDWRDVGLGAAFTSLLFTIGKTLIGLYLGKASIGSTYGAAGSLVIVLVWVYYSAQIFFFGAEFTKVFACAKGSRRSDGKPNPPAAKPDTSRGQQPKESSPEMIAAASGNAALSSPFLYDHTMVERDKEAERQTLAQNLAILVGSVAGLGSVIARAFKKQS